MSCTDVIVTLDRGQNQAVRRLVREHGPEFDYRHHTDTDGYASRSGGTAVLVACRCPGGHGVARLPLVTWVRKAEAMIGVSRTTAPPRPAATVIVLPVNSPNVPLRVAPAA